MTRPFDIPALQAHYSGFFIDRPVGNNAFSFEQRKNRRIFVAPLIEGGEKDLAVGELPAFSEIQDGREMNRPGLKNFVHLSRQSQDIFIFDNHNHAFFFWAAALKGGRMAVGLPLVHVDQHRDTREPPSLPSVVMGKGMDLRPVFEYTNFVLNVGNFIRPALSLGMFSTLQIVDSRAAFAEKPPLSYVLDLDMDIFSDEMNYIPEDLKREKIRDLIAGAALVTVATSPYFMDQARAVELIREILS
ncbi:MAG: UPF0489 family protein [Candidatus Omnitrophota bacterium]|nr:UPF0489 family protein [Candidatus Omnitrophota bacterium]MDZ4242067.1 UPF0489 family protein [Candidatus Omnitrophota bacterium]